MVSQDGLKRCPVYGVSKETLAQIIKDKAEKELQEKLNALK